MKDFNLKEYLAESKLLNEETSSLVYVVIPFYSDGVSINENDVMVFKNYNDADNYVNGLEGSPIVIETELKSRDITENKLLKEDVLDKVIALSTKFAPPSKEKLLRDLMGEINSDPELKSAFQEFRDQDDFADERITAGRYSAGDILTGMEDYLFRKQRN